MIRCNLHKEERGYTLPEVLAALLFFAFGILALYRLQAAVIKSGAHAGQLTQATALAESRMEALLALNYVSLTSAANPQAIGPYSVNWTITPNVPVPDTKTIRVFVAWKGSKNEPHTLTLDSIKGN
jgi:Tfp pilus assembly protein PilV